MAIHHTPASFGLLPSGFFIAFSSKGQPSFDVKPKSVEEYSWSERKLDCKATFHCSSSGDPEPHIQWLRDGKLIHNYKDKSPSVQTVSSGRHQATITCRATNVWKSVDRSAKFLCLPRGHKATGTMGKTGMIAMLQNMSVSNSADFGCDVWHC